MRVWEEVEQRWEGEEEEEEGEERRRGGGENSAKEGGKNVLDMATRGHLRNISWRVQQVASSCSVCVRCVGFGVTGALWLFSLLGLQQGLPARD